MAELILTPAQAYIAPYIRAAFQARGHPLVRWGLYEEVKILMRKDRAAREEWKPPNRGAFSRALDAMLAAGEVVRTKVGVGFELCEGGEVPAPPATPPQPTQAEMKPYILSALEALGGPVSRRRLYEAAGVHRNVDLKVREHVDRSVFTGALGALLASGEVCEPRGVNGVELRKPLPGTLLIHADAPPFQVAREDLPRELEGTRMLLKVLRALPDINRAIDNALVRYLEGIEHELIEEIERQPKAPA